MSAMLKLARDDSGEPEIFRSIQGEGRAIGRPRTFLRLSGCNLHCVWCDTAYTWNWEGTPFAHERAAKFHPAAEMIKLSVAEAADLIRALPSEGVVITGGEPLLQADALIEFIDALRQATPLIEIETNGSIAPPDALTQRVDLFMVSPKLAHSANDAAVALNDHALSRFAQLDTAFFKFVAKCASDVGEASAIAARFGVPAERVYIMPEGTTSETIRARAAELTAAAESHGFHYSDRLHIHLFGQKRGI